MSENDFLVVDLGAGSEISTVKPWIFKKIVGITLPDSIKIITIDLAEEADYTLNLEHNILPFKKNSIDIFYSSHTFEHLSDIEHIMREIYRCIKPDGTIVIRVPHYSWPRANMPFHKLYYCYGNSFSHYISETTKKKGLEHYSNVRLKYVRRRLRFGRYSQFFAEPIFNLFPEFYEKYISAIFPCAEILFVMKPLK